MSVEDMLISIIVPTYNRQDFIVKTIQSILSQTYSNFEVLIVDDGSTDETEAVVRSIGDERVKYFKKQNGERGAARNYGVSKANGDLVTFVDSDDLLYPFHFEEAISVFKTNPEADVVHLAYEYRDTQGELLDTKKHWSDVNEQLIRGNVISCIGIFLKRGVLKGDLLFSENRALSGTEDWLLWLRVAARYKFYYSDRVTACMINHDSRSVLNFDEQEMLTRTSLLMSGLREDEVFIERYGHYLGKIEAHMLSYIALHLQLSNKKKAAWAYFVRSVKLDASELFTKRSLAILKRQILQ